MQNTGNGVILSINNLTRKYGELIAVNGLSLDVFRGEIFGFLGPNGAGKTTTISMICGLLKLDSGDISIAGRSILKHYREIKKKIGLCPQDLIIWESLTCLEQLEFTGRLYDVPIEAARKRSLELLERLGLKDKSHKFAKTLSGGMKRRLNIALALIHEPEILVLDEPQAGLDPQSRILVREYIRSLTGNITIILTTHDMDEADRLSDRIAIIDHGRLLVLDTPENLKRKVGEGGGDILEIKLANDGEKKIKGLLTQIPNTLGKPVFQKGSLRIAGKNMMEQFPKFLDILRDNGLEIQDMTIRKKTLEDVFIALTGRGLRE